MGDTLMIADMQKAYVLADMGTILKYGPKNTLKVLFEGDNILKNFYSVIAVNPVKFPETRYREAIDFIAFVTSLEGQRLIATYKKHGVNLFYPDAIPALMEKKK